MFSAVQQFNPEKVAALDWDGPLRRGLLMIDFASFLAAAGQFSKTSLDAMHNSLNDYRRNAITYERLATVVPELYALGLMGRDPVQHRSLAEHFISLPEFYGQISRLGHNIFAMLREATHIHGAIISGAPHSVLSEFAKKAGISAVFGATTNINGFGRFDGGLLDNPALSERKKEIVHSLVGDCAVRLGVGDSISDVPLLERAQYRIIVGDDLGNRWPRSQSTLMLSNGDINDALDFERLTALLSKVVATI